ncbi:MAG TPA: phospholipase D-like domain-containing protein [Bacteriovoracaceae bacterium]|nr:phospholipase D-like domain-containing protein [Bacteriovoracaceae bacterium]
MMKTIFALILCLFAAHGEASIKTYLNHNQGSRYTDPYRKITRPGDNLEQVILDEIGLANKSIYLAVQEMRLPLVAQALIQKKNQGVDVRVVLEHDYNYNIMTQRDVPESDEHDTSKVDELTAFVDVNKNGKIEIQELETRDAMYMLQKAGIPILDDTSDASKGSALMHHKFMVVDEKSTIISTANFTMSCIHGDLLSPSSRGNANSVVQINSVALSKLFNEEFKQLWGNGKRGNFGHNKTYRGPQTVTVSGAKITVQFSPTSRRYLWEESVNGLIAQHLGEARQSVKSALFVFSEQRIANVLEIVSNLGVGVGVLIEPKFAYRYYSELLDMLGLEMLNAKCAYEPDNRPWANPIKEAGMARLAIGDVLHHKFAVVDGKTVIVGSQNWSDAANHLNDETLIVIQNQAISDVYTQEYERLKKSSFLGTPSRTLAEIQEIEESCEAFRQQR